MLRAFRVILLRFASFRSPLNLRTSPLPAGTGTHRVTWRPALVAGRFEVQVRHPANGGNVTDASFTVHHAAGSQEILIDQTANGGQWVSLGTFDFTGGTDGHVELTDASEDDGSDVVADAVRFVPVEIPTPDGLLCR